MAVRVVIVSGILALAGCASALKKQCEGTNWFDHGYKVAMRGERLDSDSFIKSCEKEEIRPNAGELDTGFKAGMENYCKSDVVFQTGKDGQFFNTDLCDPSAVKNLKIRHNEGVRTFCVPSNGYPVGSSGRVYNKICPQDLEWGFLKEYKRGRKVWLTQTILSKEAEINQIESEIVGYERERNRLTVEAATLPSGLVETRQQRRDPMTGNLITETTRTEDADTKNKRDRLRWDMDSVNNKINLARQRQQTLRSEILELRREKDTME